MRSLLLVCPLLLLLGVVVADGEEAYDDSDPAPLLLVICVNGFRWDYMAKYNVPTPMLDYIANTGVRAKYVESIFPAKPLPNTMSMVTGLYAENHGFVGDNMLDPEWNEKWTTWSWPNGAIDDGNSEKSTKWFDNAGEPVWITNSKGGSDRRSGLMMWPMGAIDFPGSGFKLPRYRSYNATVPYIDRIDQIIEWFNDPKTPINFGLLYVEMLENLGRTFGPNHPKIREGLFMFDNLIGYLFQRLQEVKKFDQMNLMIVSGHGMSEIKDTVTLSDFVKADKFELIDKDQLWPKPEHAEEVEEQLQKISRLRLVPKEDLPDYLHIRQNKRTAPITLRWDEGWVGKVNRFDQITNRGDHGFDPAHRNMRSAFFARGPAFKNGVLVSGTELNTVDLYPLICRVLQINPLPNNGTYSHVSKMIEDDYAEAKNTATTKFSSTIVTVAALLAIFLRFPQ